MAPELHLRPGLWRLGFILEEFSDVPRPACLSGVGVASRTSQVISRHWLMRQKARDPTAPEPGLLIEVQVSKQLQTGL